MKRALGWGLLALTLLAGCVPEQQVQTGGQCVPKPAFQAPPVNPCADSERVRLTIVGDVLLHWPIQQTGYKYGFRKMWAQADPYLAWGDLTVGNMEGPIAPGVNQSGRQVGDPGPVYGTGVYTGFPMFNYHPQILKELKASGFDLMTTANNHAMDRGSLGADLTLREMAKAGLGAVGTIRSGAARRFAVRRGTALGTVSFIGCSFSTNGNPDPKRQVLLCYGNRSELLSLVRQEAADPSVAAVIVLPHWGQEYSSTPDTQQVALARDLAAAGGNGDRGHPPPRGAAVSPVEHGARAGGAGGLFHRELHRDADRNALARGGDGTAGNVQGTGWQGVNREPAGLDCRADVLHQNQILDGDCSGRGHRGQGVALSPPVQNRTGVFSTATGVSLGRVFYGSTP